MKKVITVITRIPSSTQKKKRLCCLWFFNPNTNNMHMLADFDIVMLKV